MSQNNPAFLRKSMFIPQNTNRRLSVLGPSATLISFIPPENKSASELEEIFQLILAESNEKNGPYHSSKVLSFYIRKNRNSIEEIIKKLSGFFDNYYNNLNKNLVLSIVNSMLNLLTEKSQIINFLNKMLPILVNILNSQNDNSFLEKINYTIGRLIKIGGIYTRKIIENYINFIFNKFLKNPNLKIPNLLLLCKIIENSPLVAYNKITEKNLFQIFLKTLEDYKDPNKIIRDLICELIGQFIHMLNNRDFSIKFTLVKTIYFKIYKEFTDNTKDDNPSNYLMVIGLMSVIKKIYNSEPLFFKDSKTYISLVNNISKCKNSKNQNIRVACIKFIPDLYQINKELFIKNYANNFFQYSNKNLTTKTNAEIRNAFLETLGNLSLTIKNEIFEISVNPLISLIDTLINDKGIFDVEIFKCLADLLNNKEGLFNECIVTKFDIFSILSKLFKTGLTAAKIDFVLATMRAYSSYCIEHLSVVIVSLNIISLILCDSNFELQYFNNDFLKNQPKKNQLEDVLTLTRKQMKKYLQTEANTDNNSSKTEKNELPSMFYIQCKCLNNTKIISYALYLFSQISNSEFYKDMLVFYYKNILPFLLYSQKKIRIKILDIILCKFVKIYQDDMNFSEYYLNNILSSLRNLVFSVKDNGTKIYALSILHKKKVLQDIILLKKEYFCCKLIGILSSGEEDNVKEKIIQTVGILALRSNDKAYFITFVRKNITKILFSLNNCDDIIQSENLIILLLYYTIYLKNIFDMSLVEEIMEVLINILLLYDFPGFINTDILKIICELLDTDLVNNKFLINDNSNNNKINQYCNILLIICSNNIKEGGDNEAKTEISLKVLYQIIQKQNINIYKDIYKTSYINESLKNLSQTIDINLVKNINFLSTKEINDKKNQNKQNQNNKNKNKHNEKNDYNNELKQTEENGDKINIVETLLQYIIKGCNDESLKTIMNIFGLSGAMEPIEMEKYFINQGISIYHLEGGLNEQDAFDDIDNKIYKFNPKTNKNEEIDLSSIEASTYKPILSLMRLLKENSQQDLTWQIISEFKVLIEAISPNEENLIEIILPTIIQIFPEIEAGNQLKIFDYILLIIEKFKNKIKASLSDLVNLCKEYIIYENYQQKICKILECLFDRFVNEMEIYYPIFFPIFISILQTNEKEPEKIIKIFIIMLKNNNFNTYLSSVLEEICIAYLKSTETLKTEYSKQDKIEKINNTIDIQILTFIEKIILLDGTYLTYPLIIRTLIKKFKVIINPEFYISMKDKTFKNNPKDRPVESVFNKNYSILNNLILKKSIDIFTKMNDINRDQFITFLPMIIKECKYMKIIKTQDSIYQNLKLLSLGYEDYAYMEIDDLPQKLFSQICLLNCYNGFNKSNIIPKQKSKKNSTMTHSRQTSGIENSQKENNLRKNTNRDINNLRTNTISNINISSKNRKNQVNNELILKSFDTSSCIMEEDWTEWFKTTSKVLFEQSPSISLYYCHGVSDYYFPLIVELYNYAFFSVYINNNDQNKIKLTEALKSALENSKTPNDILLTILNLAEFIERRNVNMFFIDYFQFGQIAYKCRAFAKALYYKENNFIIKNDFNDLEDLIELYYELKLPESAIGLLKLAEKNKDKLNNISNKMKRESYTLNFISKPSLEKSKDKDEYKWYMKLHKYEEALDMISKRLLFLSKEDNEDLLKHDRDICLKGLCDWEELLTLDEEEKNMSKENENNSKEYENNSKKNEKNNKENENENLQATIEKEILLSRACMNLGEWNQLRYHFSKMNQLFKGNNYIDEQLIINKGENDDKDLNYFEMGDTNEDTEITEDEEFLNNHKDYFSLNKDLIKQINNNFVKNNRRRTTIGDNNNNINNININNLNNNLNNSNNISILNQEIFVSYNELINGDENLGFLANNEDLIFDLNLYSSVLNIECGKYQLALEYISTARKLILSRIKSLMSESYVRGYEILIKNQMLFNLEQIIDYKLNHQNETLYFNQMVRGWDKNLESLGEDPFIYEQFLAIRSLVLPIEKEYSKYMNLSKMCRKLELYKQSEKILARLKKKLKLNDDVYDENNLIKNEVQIQIELNYNKCLFEKGDTDDAINRSKFIVELLENAEKKKKDNNDEKYKYLCEINDKLKSRIYGDYAVYKQKCFIFDKNLLNKDNQQFQGRLSLRFNPKFINTVNSGEIKINEEEDSNAINHYFNLATDLNKNSYRLWHYYGLFNYRYYKFIFSNIKIDNKDYDKNDNNTKEISFAINAVNGFRNSVLIGGKNLNLTYQDLLRLIDIFFALGNKSEELLKVISSSFDVIDVDTYLNVIPQLLCRFSLKESNVLNVLIDLLTKIGIAHPNALIYSLIVMKYSNSKKRKSTAIEILNKIENKNNYYKNLIEECEMFINELNKCAMLLHEEWSETIEDVAKVFQNKDYLNLVNQMLKLHEKINNKPQNMYEVHFMQKFSYEIKDAEEYIRQYMNTKDDNNIKEAWEIYFRIYRNISDYFKTFEIISLEYVSPKLYNFTQSNIALPGSYYIPNHINNFGIDDDEKNINIQENNINKSIIRIKKIGDTMKLFNSKQHPRKMYMIGTDEKEYNFLLKGHEDLRQDERAMQLFDLVNTILANDKSTCNKNLYINTYSVLPLSHNAGIIGWVSNCDTLHQLIKEQRQISNTIPSVEHRKVYKLFPKFESGNFLSKVEIFKEALYETHGTELNNIIWLKSKNCETWLNRRTNYSRSLAVMSMVGYILGLGDRHPSNLMMSRKTGKIIHIDFGDCFEVAMKREKFPEKVPFRLTRMLIKALEVSGIEGTFRLICIKVMELLRLNKDSLLAILGSFIHDPLISFRLMVPMIVKKRKEKIKIVQNKIKKYFFLQLEKKGKNFNVNEVSASVKVDNGVSGKISKLLKSNEKKLKNEVEIKEDEKVEDIKNEEKIEDEEKNAKKKMEEDERQIFNMFEANDEIESEELNEIAQIVLDRILDKLNGTDFNPNDELDPQTQVDKLIRQATSCENLAQSYLGWCPFW